jgi:single-stranded DNA-binding protein
MNINKCIISGILCQPPSIFSNELGDFVELRINQTQEFVSEAGKKITSIIQLVILYFGKLKTKIHSFSTGQRVYIDGNLVRGNTILHSSPSIILSTCIHPVN